MTWQKGRELIKSKIDLATWNSIMEYLYLYCEAP